MSSKKKNLTYVLLGVFCFWWLPFSVFQPSIHDFEDGDTLEHVGDSYMLHFGSIHCGLPIILYKKGSGLHVFLSSKLQNEHHEPVAHQGFQLLEGELTSVDGATIYDFSITKNVVWMLISILLMLLVFIGLTLFVRRKEDGLVSGLWVLPFFGIRFVRDEIARPSIGEKHYERFTPYLLTLFFYILFNNLLGLLPEGANVTGNISVTLTLATFTFFITQWNGNKHYWQHIFCPPGIPFWMLPIMIPVELLGLVIKPLSLMLRLFANMLSGHMVLLSIIGLIFTLKSAFSIAVAIPLAVGLIPLKIFVSFVQAYVFTLLSAKAFGKAVEEEHS